MTKRPQIDLTKEEIDRRRDEALKRALNTPPKPLKKMPQDDAMKIKRTQSRRDAVGLKKIP